MIAYETSRQKQEFYSSNQRNLPLLYNFFNDFYFVEEVRNNHDRYQQRRQDIMMDETSLYTIERRREWIKTTRTTKMVRAILQQTRKRHVSIKVVVKGMLLPVLRRVWRHYLCDKSKKMIHL